MRTADVLADPYQTRMPGFNSESPKPPPVIDFSCVTSSPAGPASSARTLRTLWRLKIPVDREATLPQYNDDSTHNKCRCVNRVSLGLFNTRREGIGGSSLPLGEVLGKTRPKMFTATNLGKPQPLFERCSPSHILGLFFAISQGLEDYVE